MTERKTVHQPVVLGYVAYNACAQTHNKRVTARQNPVVLRSCLIAFATAIVLAIVLAVHVKHNKPMLERTYRPETLTMLECRFNETTHHQQCASTWVKGRLQ